MIETMVFTNCKYKTDQGGNNASIQCELNGQLMSVAVNAVGNRHYDEIVRQVSAGTITIADAD